MVSTAVEKSAKSLSLETPMIREKASNPLHLSRRKAVSFAKLKTFVPGLPLGHDFSLRRHRFRPSMF